MDPKDRSLCLFGISLDTDLTETPHEFYRLENPKSSSVKYSAHLGGGGIAFLINVTAFI